MKNKIKFISIILIFFVVMEIVFSVSDYTYATISDKKTMLIASGVTIKDTTTLEEVISQYGQNPKLTTTSVFGGTANTFYKDNYEDLLYVETDELGVVMSAGTCAREFQSSLTNKGDPFNGTVRSMQGYTIDDWDEGAIGVVVYNSSVKTYSERKKFLDKWYSNQYEYEKNLCQHAILIVNCFLTRDGDENISFNEKIYDTLAKIEENGKNLYTYGAENYKDDRYKTVGSDIGYLATVEALPNPFRPADGASGFLPTETKKYGYFRYHLTLSDSNEYTADIEKYYVSEELVQKGWEEIALTADEEAKYEDAKNMYQKFLDEVNQSEGYYITEPVYDKLPLVAGKIYENRLIGAVDYLNSIRVAAGLPIVKHNTTLSNAAQHKSVLCMYMKNYSGVKYANDHFPPKIDEISQDFYDTAMGNMSAENLYNGDVVTSIYHAINDSQGDQVTCGHRYNLLEPYWTDFGLGDAGSQSTHRFSGTQSYTNEIVAWPSAGVTPVEAYTGGYWTCRFYKNYSVTDDTTVEVTRLNDNKTWNFVNKTTAGTNRFAINYNLLSFYNSDLTGRDGYVYKFTIHNVKNLSTGEITDYKYRTVFKNLYAGAKIETPRYPESISLDKTEVNLEKNQKINLKTAFGGQDLTEICVNFSSNMENIASVNQYGIVTAKNEGIATISATTLNGKVATCKVRVVDGILVDEKSVTMMPNTTKKIDVIVGDGVTLTWKSSDSKIVDVDSNGNIKAKKVGKAKITITASNNREVVVEVNVIKYQKGDLNRDGKVNAADATRALEIFKNESATAEDLEIGDMDGRNGINANDATMILEVFKNSNI